VKVFETVVPCPNPVLNGKSSESDSVPLNFIEIVPVVPAPVVVAVTMVTKYSTLIAKGILLKNEKEKKQKEKGKIKRKKEKAKGKRRKIKITLTIITSPIEIRWANTR